MLSRNVRCVARVAKNLHPRGQVLRSISSSSMSRLGECKSFSRAVSISCNGMQTKRSVGGIRMFSVDVSQLAMPSLSPTMTHGTISLWKAAPGSALKAGDVLCEIETDKASVGFEMQEDCVLAKILVAPHATELAVGLPIALTVEDEAAYAAFLNADPSSYKHLEGTGAPASAAPASSPEPAVGTAPAPASQSNGPQLLSPAARHMAQSQGLNTLSVVGTAKGGRISKSDLVLAVKSGVATLDASKKHVMPASTAQTAAPVAAPAAVAPSSSAVAAPVATSNQAPANNFYKDIPNSNMRKVIAKRLTESKATVPHFYASIECEIDSLMALRKTFKKDLNLNISVNDLVIKSAALALRDVPEANSRWNKASGSIDASTSKQVDISVAVATPNGLITPILTGADKRGLVDINSTVKDLAGRARDGKLKPEEYQGGSFSISNLGMFGITSFSAVINPPQACILAVGAGIQKVLPPKAGGPNRPRVVTTVTVQLSADRRVVDEAIAAQYLQVFQSYLSNPHTIML